MNSRIGALKAASWGRATIASTWRAQRSGKHRSSASARTTSSCLQASKPR
jgi:hypothetical protein